MSDDSISHANEDETAGVAVVQRLYEAFERRDSFAALAGMAPQIVWNEAENFIYSDRNPYGIPAEVAEGVFGGLASEWSDYQATTTEIFAAGDAVAAIGRSTGAHLRTGKSLDAQFVHIWRLRGDRIVGFQQFTDTLQFWRVTHV
jgi:ketosteroid isomerase-like protein